AVVERFLVSAIAITLQRGNAAILREGASLLEHPRSSRSPRQHQLYFRSREPYFSSYTHPRFSTRSAFGWNDGGCDASGGSSGSSHWRSSRQSSSSGNGSSSSSSS